MLPRLGFLLLFVFVSLYASFIIDRWTLNRLPHEIRTATEHIPRDIGPHDLDTWEHFDTVLNWAIKEDHQLLLNVLVQRKYEQFLLMSVSEAARKGSLERVILLLKMVESIGLEAKTFLFPAFYSAVGAASTSGKPVLEWIPLFSFFLEHHEYPAHDFLLLEDALANLLASSLDAKLLDLLMSDARFPVLCNENEMSRAWFTVLTRLMDTDNFGMFRRIISEWLNFRRNVMLNKTHYSYLREVIPESLQEYALIIYAIEQKLTTYVWVLTGRTYIFKTLCRPAFARSRWGRELYTNIIPSLNNVPWASTDSTMQQKLVGFLQSTMESQLENEHAQTLLLSSSYWQGNITAKPAEAQECREMYVEHALSSCSKPMILAAARNGVLTTAALQRVYVTDCFRDLAFFKQIDRYCGPADMMGLQYGGYGLAMIHLLLIINNPSANFYELKKAKRILSQASRTGSLMLLYQLDQLEAATEAEIMAHSQMTPSVLALSNVDPSIFSTFDNFYELLVTFSETGCEFCSAYIVKHVTLPVLMDCLSFAIEDNNGTLLPSLTEEAMARSDESRDDCLEDIYNAVNELGVSPALYSVCTAFTSDQLVTLISWCATDGHYELIKMLISLQRLESTQQWYTALKASHLYPRIFELLWHQFPVKFESEEVKAFVLKKIHEEILCPALDHGDLEVVSTILKHPEFPQDIPCVYDSIRSFIFESIRKGQIPAALTVLLDSPYASGNLDLAFDHNSLLKCLLSLGETALCKILLKNYKVFSEALKEGIPLLFKMFAELKLEHAELSQVRLRLLHRKFVKAAL